MRSPVTNHNLFKRKCKLYNAETQTFIAEFESMAALAEFLGIQAGHVSHAIKYKHVIKATTNRLNVKIAIR